MELLAALLLLFVGGLLALQAGANVQLSTAMASPFGASTLQLAVAATILLALAAVAGSLGALARVGNAEPWHLIGGLGSAIYITSGILLPHLGALVTVGLFIGGQMLGSLALDGFGWFGVATDGPGPAEAAGAGAAILGSWLIVRAEAGAEAIDKAVRERRRWIVVALAAGAALPFQGALNAQFRDDLDAAPAAAAASFLVATAAMALALASVLTLGAPRPKVEPLARVPWWAWLGGICGATYVTSVLLIPELGAAAVVALTVAGQQLTSVAVDRYGWLRLPRRRISRRRLFGVAVLLTGVALITLP